MIRVLHTQPLSKTHVAWLARLKERKKNQRNQILIGKLLIVDFFHEQDRQEIATRSTTTGLSVATERLGYTLVQACARAPRSSFAQSVLRIVPIAGQIKRDTGVYTSYIASFLWTRDHEAWILLLNVSRVASRFASSCKPAHPVLSRVQHRKIAIRQSAYRPPSRSTMLSLAMLIEKCTLQCNRMIESYNSHCMNIPRENWIDNKDWSID